MVFMESVIKILQILKYNTDENTLDILEFGGAPHPQHPRCWVGTSLVRSHPILLFGDIYYAK